MEHPGPPGPLADPHAGLVRLQNGAGEQAGADQARLPGKGRPAGFEDIDQRPFADLDPKQVRHQPRQPLERDRMGEAQVDGKSPQVGAEGRARLQSCRRDRLEASRAARAGPAVQHHPRHVRRDLG